jgi:hypothetical protein
VDLEAASAGFARFYNCERYHEALGDVTPEQVLTGRMDEIMQRRKEMQDRTIADRRTFNQSRRSQPSPAFYQSVCPILADDGHSMESENRVPRYVEI